MATGILNSVLTAALWALTGIFVKLLSEIPVFDILLYRSLVAFLFFLLAIIYKEKLTARLNFPQWGTFQASALMFLYYASATLSFYLAPVAAAAIFISTSPCFAMIIKSFHGIHPRLKEILGFGVSFISLIIFSLSAINDFEGYAYGATVAGSLLGVAAGFFRALYSYLLWSRPTAQSDLNHISINTFLLAIIILFPIHFILGKEYNLQSINFLYIIGLGVLATALPNLLHSLASRKIDPTIHSVIGTLTPIIAAGLAWLIFDEDIPTLGIAAMTGSITGIILMTAPQSAMFKVRGTVK
jgi:drug/metabolite transporter (DMT)-like permease